MTTSKINVGKMLYKTIENDINPKIFGPTNMFCLVFFSHHFFLFKFALTHKIITVNYK